MKYILLILLAFGGSPALALSIALVRSEIEVNVDFSGGEVTVFAVSESAPDLDTIFAVALVGPVYRHRVIHHARQVQVRNFYAPSVLSIVAEPDFFSRLTKEMRQDAGFEPTSAAVAAPDRLDGNDPAPIWYDALADLKTEAGMFSVQTGVQRLYGGLIRADLPLPAQSPVGEYRVRALVFRGGELWAEAEERLTLRRKGAEHFLYTLSRQSAGWYGVLAVMIGLFAGGIGAWFGRR